MAHVLAHVSFEAPPSAWTSRIKEVFEDREGDEVGGIICRVFVACPLAKFFLLLNTLGNDFLFVGVGVLFHLMQYSQFQRICAPVGKVNPL